MARELVRTGLAIQAAVGYFPRFHRSPVGVKSPPRAFVAGKLGLALVGWTRRALDGGARPLNEKSVQRLLNDTRDGDIVALHDGKLNLRGESIAASADADAFAKALETLVSGLTQKGFQLVALDEATGMSRDLPGAPQSLETMPAMGYFAMARYVVNRVVFANVGAAEVIGGFALGVFLGCSPFLGARAVLSVIVAGRLRLNRAAAAIGSGVGYPFLASPLIAAAIWVGQTIMTGAPPAFSATAFQYHPLTDIADHFFWPWLIGFPLVGGLAAVIAWLVLSFLFVPRKSRF